MRLLVAGATGFIGGRLARALRPEHEVRCLVRDRSRATELEAAGCEVVEGDALDAASLGGIADGIDVAYYLIHSMGRGGDAGYAERDARAASNFAEALTAAGVSRCIYLGGLGRPKSEHLRSRHETAQVLSRHGPPLTYFRAGMVVGAASESFRTLRALVERLPVMIAPGWLRTPTQPIAAADAIAYLAQAPEVQASAGREIEIGGPDVLAYGEMLDRMADALGIRRRPRVPVPILTPWLSSLWIGLVTPVDAGVARPLVEGLSTKTVVEDRSGMDLFGIEPVSFDAALREALRESG